MRCLLIILFFAPSLVNGFRLPNNVIPKNYVLEITAPFGEKGMNSDFQGRVQIMIACVYPTSNITLHSKDLKIIENEVSIRNAISEVSETVKGLRITYEKEHDFLIIHLDKPLIKDHRYEVGIPYTGIVTDGPTEGFYRSNYKDSKTGKTKWLASTYFLAINARRAFPCFDEPAMKATFKLFIARKDGYISISNMPLIKTEQIGNRPGWFWDQFAMSKPMSTYLVAWVVSEFEATELKYEFSNVTFKIWSRMDALDQGTITPQTQHNAYTLAYHYLHNLNISGLLTSTRDIVKVAPKGVKVTFASEVAPKLLRFFENYFGIDYPLPKLDMIAISDFPIGAMENWGLITFSEDFLLYDPKVSTKINQRRMAFAIAHELAHQWFGNLVTMNWWTDLWLPKGFATYMASVALHHLFPEWNSFEQDITISMLGVFWTDSFKSAHPVHVPIGDPKEITQLFDTITFSKGSSLIRMMSLFLGEKTFRSGVINYVNQYRYQNAHQDDLWESLTEAARREKTLPKNFTVQEIMDTWTLKSGFPVVSVKRNYETGSAEITQERFLTDSTELKSSNSCWWVPLTYSTKSEPHFNITTPKCWLRCDVPKSKTVKHVANKDDWVVFNNKMSGIYKVNYDKTNWHMLANALKENYTQIPALNRALLFSDAAAFARIGDLPYDVLFDLLGYLEHETEYLALKVAFDQIEELGGNLKLDSEYELFANYMKSLLTPMYKKVGGVVVKPEDDENVDKIKMQVRVVKLSCKYEVQECLDDVQKLFKKYEEHPNEPNPIPKDLTDIVYCNAIELGGVKEWDFLWKKYVNSNVASEKYDIMVVLARCPREAWLLERYLEWSLDKLRIPKPDAGSVFNWVASSNLGYPIAKKFIYKNVEKLAQYLKEKSFINVYISALTNRMHDLEDVEEFEKFIKKHDNIFLDIRKIVDRTRETIKIHTQWQAKHGQQIQKVLKKYHKKSY